MLSLHIESWAAVKALERCRAIAEVLGYQHCTAVQAESLGPLLSGADMVVKAKTGTGKTLAFLIPGIEQVSILVVTVSWLECSQCYDELTLLACRGFEGPRIVELSIYVHYLRRPMTERGHACWLDAEEPTRQEHRDAGDQPHPGAGSADC